MFFFLCSIQDSEKIVNQAGPKLPSSQSWPKFENPPEGVLCVLLADLWSGLVRMKAYVG